MKGKKKELALQIVSIVNTKLSEAEQASKKLRKMVGKVAKKLANKIIKVEKRATKKSKKLAEKEQTGGEVVA
ncbi:hypothetical protein [Dyadobacter arcticus]|uniref:Uncharacterized protein n=1 Tax=Dyadobacter arcticus TaxID=1078754 RepID=A0ABX0ULE7_9BACT|nr:hypothetical protein [Dyadobacter arcticus]NIJ52455.1 hypothetical protein [Dyadobacter arcticus]